MRIFTPAIIMLLVFCITCCDDNTSALDPAPVKLSTPTGIIIKNGHVQWDIAENAIGYKVQVGPFEDTSPDNEYNLSSISGLIFGQDYDIRVMAIGDGSVFLDSDFSDSIKYQHTIIPGGDDIIIGSIPMTAEPEPNGKTINYSFTDGLYNYYFIYMGVINNVPISYAETQMYTGSPITLSYKITDTEETSITRSISKAISDTTSVINRTSTTQSLKSTIKGEIGLKGSLTASVSSQIEAGWSYTKDDSTTTARSLSTTDTWTTFQSLKTSKEETFTYSIGNNGEPQGYYRYTLFANCDTWVALVYDTLNMEYYYDFYTFAKENTYYRAIDYNESNDYSNREISQRFIFDESTLASLPLPINNYSSGTIINDYSSYANNSNIGQVNIKATDMRVIFIGNNSKTFSMNIEIESRTRDLLIILCNMNFTGPAGANGISSANNKDGKNAKPTIEDSSNFTNKHNVCINIIGNNYISGGNGGNGANGFNSSNQRNGGNGGNGGDCINIKGNHLYIYGSGTITVTGGQGGNGGNGQKADIFASVRTGGQGGRGGYGLYCGNAEFVDGYNSLTVIVTGGNGGDGWTGGDSGAGDYAWSLGDQNFAKGANGGNGGDGEYPLGANLVVQLPQQLIIPIKLNSGIGGTGGIGGKGHGYNGLTGTSAPNGVSGNNGLPAESVTDRYWNIEENDAKFP